MLFCLGLRGFGGLNGGKRLGVGSIKMDHQTYSFFDVGNIYFSVLL